MIVEGSLGWPFSYGLASKAEAGPKAMRHFLRVEGNCGVMRCDNEPALKGEDSMFIQELAKPRADPFTAGYYRATPVRHGAPYQPTFQSRVERWNGVQDNLGAMI